MIDKNTPIIETMLTHEKHRLLSFTATILNGRDYDLVIRNTHERTELLDELYNLVSGKYAKMFLIKILESKEFKAEYKKLF